MIDFSKEIKKKNDNDDEDPEEELISKSENEELSMEK